MVASVSPAFAEVDITGAINSAVSGGQANVSLPLCLLYRVIYLEMFSLSF
ncbi:hypothetical protein [Vibrio parahaemolyticus]|nr:hypothetical protein [Vibrio parahaemolyticus]